jgi:hypothetical protein
MTWAKHRSGMPAMRVTSPLCALCVLLFKVFPDKNSRNVNEKFAHEVVAEDRETPCVFQQQRARSISAIAAR